MIINDYYRINESRLLNELLEDITSNWINHKKFLIIKYITRKYYVISIRIILIVHRITKYRKVGSDSTNDEIDGVEVRRLSKQARGFAYAHMNISSNIEHLRHRRFSATELLNPRRFMISQSTRVASRGKARGKTDEGERKSIKKIGAAYAPAFRKRLDAQPLKVTGICTCRSSS